MTWTERSGWTVALVRPVGSVNLAVTLSMQPQRLMSRGLVFDRAPQHCTPTRSIAGTTSWGTQVRRCASDADWCGQAVLGKAAAPSMGDMRNSPASIHGSTTTEH